MSINLSYYEHLFSGYVSSFLTGNPREQAIVSLKLDHSVRVLENARYITDTEEFQDDDRDIILLTSLFHDIGRFTQFKEFGTFSDHKSVNHARRGVQVLKQHGLLERLPRGMQNRVLAAVELHNRRDLPAQIDEKLIRICHVVRDSDKLDIFRIMLDHLASAEPHDPTIVLEVQAHPEKYTSKIYDSVLRFESCAYSDMRWTNDFKLMLASWIPLLNFPASYQLLHTSGNLDRLFSQLPQLDKFEILKKQLLDCVHQRI